MAYEITSSNSMILVAFAMAFASALLMIGDVIQLLAVISDYAGWRRRGLAAPAQFRRRSGPLIALRSHRAFIRQVWHSQPTVPAVGRSCKQSAFPCQQSAFRASSRPSMPAIDLPCQQSAFPCQQSAFRASSWPSVPAVGT